MEEQTSTEQSHDSSITSSFASTFLPDNQFPPSDEQEHVASASTSSVSNRNRSHNSMAGVNILEANEEAGSFRAMAGRIKTLSMESSLGDVQKVALELTDALSALEQTFVISDATKPDCPVVFASTGFFAMTGYSSDEIIGRNCRFLQGANTDQDEVDKIRNAVRNERSYCGRVLNYKKNGSPFWNLLTITPVKDDSGKTIRFIGMQVEVSKHTEGVNEKALRPNGLPQSLIRYDARQKEKALDSIEEVVQIVKVPQSLSRATSHSSIFKRQASEKSKFDYAEAVSVPGWQTFQLDPNVDRSHLGALDDMAKKSGLSGRPSSMGFKGRSISTGGRHEQKITIEPEILMTKEIDDSDSLDNNERGRDRRQGIDLATTLERIEKNFVITDPRIHDNPIVFASDSFLELTEYTREETLGINCRFLQGPETDKATVLQIREAIIEEKEITVHLINYTKTGKKFWNLFHLQPMRDQKGHVQYFIGVQIDESINMETLRKRHSEKTELQNSMLVKTTAENVDEAVRELPDANLRPEDLWAIYSKDVFPKPHKKDSFSWLAIKEIAQRGENIGLQHFKPLRPLGCGDTGSVHLVELKGSGEFYTIKAMDKEAMLNRNKVHRACIEREIISRLDHPFLPTLYASFQTPTHVCLVTDFCPGGELYTLLEKQPLKTFKEESARFYVAEVVIALEYLHCLGIIYRDLKPENILVQKDGHIVLVDFDLSFLTNSAPQVIKVPPPIKQKSKNQPPPAFVAEPISHANSFVGTEEYIAPEVIAGESHTSSIDWWTLGILLYEMLYGRTPFQGKNRQRTFSNILHKELTFSTSIPVSLQARQMINGLLHRDPTARLGSKTGANEIKQHPFFEGINWPLIRCRMPPALEVPLQLIEKDPNGEGMEWEDNGLLTNPINPEIF